MDMEVQEFRSHMVQLTEKWGDELFSALKNAGGIAYSNMAVGFDNVDVAAATKHKIPVGNTPGNCTVYILSINLV